MKHAHFSIFGITFSLHRLLPVIASSLMAACVSAPPPPPPVSLPPDTTRATALTALGFEKTDDGFVLNLSGTLLFDTGSDVLSVGAKAVLAKLAADLRALEISKLRLFGHTDNVGSAEFNRGLSGKRAEAVAVEMVSRGFSNDALERRGFGFDRPIATNDTPDGRTKNRRVSVIVPFE
jgi:outer membrane protein OmpA-like peptidoglycan-associated protein